VGQPRGSSRRCPENNGNKLWETGRIYAILYQLALKEGVLGQMIENDLQGSPNPQIESQFPNIRLIWPDNPPIKDDICREHRRKSAGIIKKRKEIAGRVLILA
jgi:hypothetical protein